MGYSGCLLVNGHTFWGIQIQTSFIGLDAVDHYGAGALFDVPVSALPDATAMFLGLAGSYPADTAFTTFCSIWGTAPTDPCQATVPCRVTDDQRRDARASDLADAGRGGGYWAWVQ